MVGKDERLLNLIAALLHTKVPIGAKQIQKQVEGYKDLSPQAFHRAFERDKDELRQQGIPLRLEPIVGTNPPIEGYRILPEEYKLPDPGLEPDELAALYLASQTVRIAGGNGEREAIWKLGGVDASGLPPDSGFRDLAVLPSDPALVSLFEAMSASQQVGFTYRDAPRRVDPWWLDFQRGRWYLTGFDHLRGEDRNYRLDRISSSVETVGPMVEPAPPREPRGPINPWELGDGEPVEARMLVDASHAAEAEQWLGAEAAVIRHDDGSATFTVPVAHFDGFRSFLFAFLEHAELLGPEDWRHEIIDWLEAIESSGGGRD